jgi:4-amino-4-deoxy-L-arabinose transferase-like glycosyltransferase
MTLFVLLINAAAMFSPVINAGDSVTYAALSQHIALHNDWMNLVLEGKDWLDKPHLPFWITALSFKIGGISAFTYILPGFLFHLIGGYYTYRIARLFYGRDAAWLAVLVYVSVYHLMDSSIEVKAETYLTGFIMGACYYWLRYDAQSRIKYLLLGALFSAMAVMTKGVFTLITIASGLVCMWVYRKQWHKLWSAKWLLALALTLAFTAPELAALYLQFDAHPEKEIFGQTHVSGIRFFLWDSQFGRFFNSGPIKNTNGHPFYFVLVFLWAFLPWVAVFIAAMYSGIRNFLVRSMDDQSKFVFLCGAFFITFLLFSATSFQLDHYTVILFPFAAIICGSFLQNWLVRQDAGRALVIAQLAITLLLAGLALGLSAYVNNPVMVVSESVLTVILLAYGYAARKKPRVGVVLVYPVFAVVMLYVFLVLAAAQTFTSYGVAYNANAQLTGKEGVPIYVYQMDIVARELGLYNSAPCYAADNPAQLPAAGRYLLLVKAESLAQLSSQLATVEPVAQGQWIIHKTGTFPRFIRMAKGAEPLEDIRIVQVGGANKDDSQEPAL